jgi:hypothetical protein
MGIGGFGGKWMCSIGASFVVQKIGHRRTGRDATSL